MRLFLALIFLATLFIVSGCQSTKPKLEVPNSRIILAPTRPEYKLKLKEAMVWLDNPEAPVRGIRLPSGFYKIEGEDEEYFYFKAPIDVEYRKFLNKKVVDKRFLAGGIYLKKYVNKRPAGVYYSIDSGTKIITWELGKDFLKMEGKKWKKNF